MTARFNITAGKPPNWAPLWLSILGLLIATFAPAFAHGGYNHVMGTVVNVANNVLTVKTAKGNVDVKLDKQTELTKNNQKAEIADLKVGARVIVDIPEGGKANSAKSVKIGAVPKTAVSKTTDPKTTDPKITDPHAHSSHK